MEIVRDDGAKVVQVWLTRQEGEDGTVGRRLEPLYAQWKQKNYLVAVFRSGPRDLPGSTLDLLAYNKKRIAQMEAARMQPGRPGRLEGG